MACVQRDEAIKAKLKTLVLKSWLLDEIDAKFSFGRNEQVTQDLVALKGAKPLSTNPVNNGEGPLPTKYDLELERGGCFLGVPVLLSEYYTRDGYDDLYEDVKALWEDPLTKHVLLLGNAGTGKSWFQIYVLMRLLQAQEKMEYKLAFRQVGQKLYLIDFEECVGYKVLEWDEDILQHFKHILYFFEPQTEKEIAPKAPGVPSLATLSPYAKRISEYKKFFVSILFLWPWSYEELQAVMQGRGCGDFRTNYYLYGGVIRHHLAPTTMLVHTKKDLDSRLTSLTLNNLKSKAANVDRDDSGSNISGYIICYDGKLEAFERKARGEDRPFFDKCVLSFTSTFVEEHVEDLLTAEPLSTKMKAVLDRLNDRVIDISGKNLEAVAAEFLSKGVNWQIKRVGSGTWTDFTTKKRKIIKDHDIAKYLTTVNHLLVPTNTSFPVADLVFSG
jgi:hypothetical protein